MVEIYGFAGNMGSGKNYVAEKIFWPHLPNKPTIIMAFADHFKINSIIFDKLPYDKVFGEKDAESRQKLQTGAENMRQKYGADVWVDFLQTWLQLYADRGIQRFIITDVRFPHEIKWLKKMGGIIIKIDAPDRHHARLLTESGGDATKMDIIANHNSETFIKTFDQYDYLINNSKTNLNVVDDVKKIINSLN